MCEVRLNSAYLGPIAIKDSDRPKMFPWDFRKQIALFKSMSFSGKMNSTKC